MDNLTPRQKEILDFIISNIKENGYPPSVREIGKGVGLKSSSSVHSHLSSLEEKGYIKKGASKPRAIDVTGICDNLYNLDGSDDFFNIPVVGEVKAGEPVLAVENIKKHLPIPADFIKKSNKDYFILNVTGESMIKAGILDGDYALVEKTRSAENGDIVVALLEDEATIKRFKKEKEHILLIPANDSMEPIKTKDVTILGRVTGIFRTIG